MISHAAGMLRRHVRAHRLKMPPVMLVRHVTYKFCSRQLKAGGGAGEGGGK